ncbi:hypothetical protein [Cellulomonas sp. Y8]|uniref:hypothetical protein n=1 Tax=Cellulomonas sp. Y8 TaxID=2591145 RepID=UPI0011CCACB5|nr:hypothetical protein [Cellulomonas sp. Y8]
MLRRLTGPWRRFFNSRFETVAAELRATRAEAQAARAAADLAIGQLRLTGDALAALREDLARRDEATDQVLTVLGRQLAALEAQIGSSGGGGRPAAIPDPRR